MALFSLPIISFLILYEVLEKESLPITNVMVHLTIDRHRQSNLSVGVPKTYIQEETQLLFV